MSLLRHHGFALLCTGQCLSMVADWGLHTMVLIWIYQLTHSGLAVSAVGLAEALPLLLLAPLAGVYVDRWSRAHTMAGACLARAALLLPALAVTSRAGVPVLVLVALSANVVAQFFQPAAAAALPVVTGADRAGQANGVLGLLQGGVGIAGPGAAAGLVALVGPHATIGVLSSLYLLAAPVLLRVPAPRPLRAGQRTTVREEMAEGIRYVRRSALLAGLLLCVVVFNLGSGGLTVIDVVFVTRTLHLHAETAGVLLVATGLGGVVGGLVMTLASRWVRQRYHVVLSLAVLAYGLAYLGYAFTPSLALATMTLGLAGFIIITVVVAAVTLIQFASADAVRGRVLSIFSVAQAVGMLVSLSCTGALIDLWGVRAVIGGAATLILVCGVLCCALVRVTPGSEEDVEAESILPLSSMLLDDAAC